MRVKEETNEKKRDGKGRNTRKDEEKEELGQRKKI